MPRSFLTAKLPMRLIAILVVIFLVSATMLYFYDTLISGFKNLTWHDQRIVPTLLAKYFALAMALTIGIGVFTESAATIWDKLMYWGQLIDNYFIKLFARREYFLITAESLLKKTRREINRTNLRLQAVIIPQQAAPEDVEFLRGQVKAIKKHCEELHKLLEAHQAYDNLHQQRQENAREHLNQLVTASLDICYYVERLSQA